MSGRVILGAARLQARRTARAILLTVAVTTATAGMAACTEDDPPPVLSDAEYRESVTALCERHMPPLQEAWDGLRASTFSDAQLAAFYRAEMVPRLRSILRSVRNGGLPAVAEIHDGINTAGAGLREIDDDPAGMIDRRRDGTFLEGENPWIEINAGLEAAQIDCAVEPNNWEP